MKPYPRLSTFYFACVLLTYSCGSNDEGTKGEPKNKVKEAVKEVVTQDFKLYEGAKASLKASDDKNKEQLEAIEKDLK